MFRLAKLSLRNRAVVALVTLAIIVGGAFSLGSLKQELIPSLELPMAGVITVYPGASAAIVEDQVVEPVEGAIRGVAGVDSVDTTSMDSVAISLVTFRYGTNMDTANQKLSTAVTRLGGSLPDDVETNVIVGSLDDFPIVSLAVSGDDGAAADATSLAQAVDAVLVPDLSKLAGVRTVDVSGYEPEVVEIELDTPAMAAAGVSATAVMDVLKNNGLAFPAGTVTEGDESLTAQIGQPLTSVDELAGLPLIAQAPSAAGAAGAGDAGAAAAAAGAGAGGAVGGDAAADADGAGAANAAGAAGSAGAGTAGGGGGNGAGTAGAAGGDA
ncbi:MAG: efflux RND transporter permease subunit, partial [Bifidobacteriaceae bacterium]|nr:efflux RND transporter permease subunit [Bifidobacteriaceae bacterium]